MSDEDMLHKEIKANEKQLSILVDVEFGSTSHKCGATMSADTIRRTKADYIEEMLKQINNELQKVIPKMLEVEGGNQNE